MKLVWRRRAVRAFLAQIAFVQAQNAGAAERLHRIVESRIGLLVRFPGMGRPTRRADVRELSISGTPYLAVYQTLPDRIVILQFFHTSQGR